MRMKRQKQNGLLPKKRNDFDPISVVKGAIGGNKVIVLDSNDITENVYLRQVERFK